MSAMHDRGYVTRAIFDSDDHIFVGRIDGINDLIGFHADSLSDLEGAFHAAVDDYTETCTKIGKPLEEPKETA